MVVQGLRAHFLNIRWLRPRAREVNLALEAFLGRALAQTCMLKESILQKCSTIQTCSFEEADTQRPINNSEKALKNNQLIIHWEDE